MENTELRDKCIKAAHKYLNIQSWEKLGDIDGFLVYEDSDGYIVFVNVCYSCEAFKLSDINTLRACAEDAMYNWFVNDPDTLVDVPVRVDELSFRILDQGRALIKHIYNAVNSL